jgi:hypothetical protein
MPPTYTITLNDNDDLSAEVLRLHWRLGMARPYDSRAAPIAAEITVRNPTRGFSPEVSSRALLPGTPIRIRSTYNSVTYTHFTGRVAQVEPTPGDQGVKQAVIYATGPEPEMMQSSARLPAQFNRRADEIAAALLESVPLRQVALAGRWLLDQSAQTELGLNTRLAAAYPRLFEAGLSTFVLCADTWQDSVSAWDALGEVVAAERGRLFINRAGEVVLLNRHHTLLDEFPLAAFTDDMVGLDYQYGAGHINRVVVNLRPRTLGAPGSILWSLVEPQSIPGADQPLRLTARFRDSAERPIGAAELLAPVAGMDWQANTRADGLGQDRTNSVSLRLTAAAAAANLEFINNSPETIFILAGARLRGTPLIEGDPLAVEVRDHAAQNRYGAATLTLDLPALTPAFAADLASFELARRVQPSGQAQAIRLRAPAHLDAMLRCTLFDRIRLTESQTGHASDAFIIAEEHTVDLGGLRHEARWLLEPADRAFWRVAAGTLGQSSVLAY